MVSLQVYQVVILALSIWLAVALIIQLPILIQAAEDATDWQVVAFRGALFFLAVVVSVRYVFDISPWVIAAGWLVLDVAATANTIYIYNRVTRQLPNIPQAKQRRVLWWRERVVGQREEVATRREDVVAQREDNADQR